MIITLLILIALVALLCGFSKGQDSSMASDPFSDKDRAASMFKVGEEWLALPEVYSVLDFNADSSFASDDDIDGQMQLRNSRFWGRLYIEGWPQTIQYFRAHFGSEPPIGRKQFVFAEPRDACEELKNGHLLTENHVLLANRGTCTYGTKAKNAQKTKATAIFIINNEAGLDHLPGPDAHDIDFSVNSIPQQEGQLLESVYDDGPMDKETGFGRGLYGYVVPINCAKGGARCLPATVQERDLIKNLPNGGLLKINDPSGLALKPDDEPLEYLLAHFGSIITHSESSFSLAVAKPADACSGITNDVKGKVVLVRRGGCPFVKKAEEVQAAGGRVMVLGNLGSHISRMGVEPRWKGLSTVIPVTMVSNRVYSILVAGAMIAKDLTVSFEENNDVNGSVWEPLEKLVMGEGWPRSESYLEKKFQELLVEHRGYPDRLATIKEAHTKRVAQMQTGSKDAPPAAKEEL